ncbi:Nodule Cysteine-Rich (NCR) secreted peptide [Medicago truncatula]|uniref:Nodule Cysteine-Rich (NCR) secreted peptide n=2 Tax=Medicago truncatula TaxID=3880 RepID=A0A072UX97_MEDTR|nr:Nodule Cysteine-Rich (NCR) secreted peptide [Medicago truncatula]
MRSMDKTIKFTYVMIIFVYLFLIATNVEAYKNRCFRDSDCPKEMCNHPKIPKCVNNAYCKCVVAMYFPPK